LEQTGAKLTGVISFEKDVREQIASDCQQPPPEEIFQFSLNHSPTPLFHDSNIKIAISCSNGSGLIFLMNSVSIPLVNFHADILGPEVLIKTTLFLSSQITARPLQCAISFFAKFVFPRQMKGFSILLLQYHINQLNFNK
jgi:hypothetical protein